jgi:hypothetical protein
VISITDKNPKIASEFDIIKNGGIKPCDITYGSSKKVWWICSEKHSWQAYINTRTSQNTGCPFCKNKKPTTDNNLMKMFSSICKEWDYSLNKKTPSEYLPYSNIKVNWICKFGHKWVTTISNRTRQNNNCPNCFKNESWSENYIFSVLSQYFNVIKHKDPELDIYIKDLNIGIEYDGYYHKFRYDSDIQKNKWAVENLNMLIRIREEYLPELPIHDNIIIVKQKNSNLISCQKSIIKILKILNIKGENINFNVEVFSKVRNNVPKEINKYWNPNNKTDISIAMKTHKYLWVCSICYSEYESELRYRIKKECCPFCASQKVNINNSLYTTHNYLIKYISPLNVVDPKTITYGTSKKVKFIFNSKTYDTTPRNFNRKFLGM